MIDPKHLLERASQLAEQARSTDDSNIRERLMRMAELYDPGRYQGLLSFPKF